MKRTTAIIILALAMAACSSGTPRPPVVRNVITEDEIRGASANWASEVVQRLRPEWLRTRPPMSLRGSSAYQPLVYVNSVRHGALVQLQSMSAADIREMRFLSPPEATQRFGTGHAGGVILVQLR
jgi:hypothetical protein